MEETAQELTDHVSQFQKYLDEHTPELISFGIKGGVAEGKIFIDSLELLSLLANIGDAKSLVIHPAFHDTPAVVTGRTVGFGCDAGPDPPLGGNRKCCGYHG